MWSLIIPTILTSSADSINPIAITQQFVLQGMVKKPKDIWYFIVPTGVTNFIGGLLAYLGLTAFIGDFISMLMENHSRLLFTLELIAGVSFLIGVCYIVQRTKIASLEKQIKAIKSNSSEINDEDAAVKKIKSVSPPALIFLGIGATISELTTALPYFAFLAILFNYNLSVPELIIILAIYNFIYTAPLMILYFIYIKERDKFDAIYRVIKEKMTKWADIIAPGAIGLAGFFLVYHSVANL